MKVAYTMATGRGDTDLLLSHVAWSLRERGYRVRGAVQINSGPDCSGPCDMDLLVLPDGPVSRISQRLGKDAKGCRLDPGALETAVGAVLGSLGTDTDCLIINKFGKHEANGRGFREAIAEALGMDIPVLVGVNRLNLDAFLGFTDGLAIRLEPMEREVMEWVVSAVPATPAARGIRTPSLDACRDAR